MTRNNELLWTHVCMKHKKSFQQFIQTFVTIASIQRITPTRFEELRYRDKYLSKKNMLVFCKIIIINKTIKIIDLLLDQILSYLAKFNNLACIQYEIAVLNEFLKYFNTSWFLYHWSSSKYLSKNIQHLQFHRKLLQLLLNLRSSFSLSTLSALYWFTDKIWKP